MFARWTLPLALLGGLALSLAGADDDSIPKVDPSKQVSSDAYRSVDFSSVVRTKAPALFAVGHPKSGTATAFCINRKHRLLVTAAHVADTRLQYGSLFAVQNGIVAHAGTWPAKGTWYEVEDVWYSPFVRRDKEKRRPGERHDPVTHPCPDVAILKLKSDGPDLPEEFELAGPDTRALQARSVGTLGFPVYAMRKVGLPQAFDRVNAVFSHGYVSRERDLYDGFTDFEGIFAKGPSTVFEHTVPFYPGQSGSPLFLSDGRVIGVAVHYWKHEIPEQDGSTACVRIPTAIHVFHVWQTIQHKDYPLRECFGISVETPQR